MSADKQIPTQCPQRMSVVVSGEASLFSLGHCRAFWTTTMRGIRSMDLPPWEIGRPSGGVVPNKKGRRFLSGPQAFAELSFSLTLRQKRSG